MGFAQMVYPQKTHLLSDTVIAQNIAEKIVTGTAGYSILKSIVRQTDVYPGGQLRIKYDYSEIGSNAVYAVFRNGVRIGDEMNATTSYQTKIQDFTFTNMRPGDIFTLQGKGSPTSFKVQNFYICAFVGDYASTVV